jgi:CubicO group peptidase (beta-lactamase class C family)
MANSVPGETLAAPTSADRVIFTQAELDRYAIILRGSAVPYRVDSSRRPTRSEYTPRRLDASTGIVTTARDLARFDIALSDMALLDRATLQAAWSRASVGGNALPTGLGWFVQNYNGELLVWQFGMAKDAYSSLILKLPNRDTTLILLANSDGLSAPYALENGDVTTSVFAKTFLRFMGL